MTLNWRKVTNEICAFVLALTVIFALTSTDSAVAGDKASQEPQNSNASFEDTICEWWPAAPDDDDSFHVGGGSGASFTLIKLGKGRFYFQQESGYGEITVAGIAEQHMNTLFYKKPRSSCMAEISLPNKATLTFKVAGPCNFPVYPDTVDEKKQVTITVFSCNEGPNAMANIIATKNSPLFKELTTTHLKNDAQHHD